MFWKIALATMIVTGSATMAQAADLSSETAAAPALVKAVADAQPRQMAGPVKIRFRKPADVLEVLNDAAPHIQREAAYYPRASRGQFD